MKQYKDELLSSCLTFVLSLHHNIVALDIKAYCPALEVGFSYLFRRVFTSEMKTVERGVKQKRQYSIQIQMDSGWFTAVIPNQGVTSSIFRSFDQTEMTV